MDFANIDLPDVPAIKHALEKKRPGFIIDITIKVRHDLPPENKTEPPHQLSPTKKITMALAVLAQHPDWSNEQIAKAVQCHPSNLSKSERFCQARRAIEGTGREDLRKDQIDYDTQTDF